MALVHHTDIRNPGWFSQLPASWVPYLLLLRLDRPIGTWLLLLPGWWGLALAGDTNPLNYLLFALGAVLMRGAGCIINDLFDRDFDRKVTRTMHRPLAAGTLSMKAALLLLSAVLFLSLLILIQFNTVAIAIGAASLLLVTIYPLMKRITWFPQLFLGFTFNWGVLLGYAASTGSLDVNAAILYLAAIFWTLGYDTIYAAQDVEDDALVGVKSTARLFKHHAKWFVAACYLVFFIATIPLQTTLIFLIALPLHFAWQLWRWRLDQPETALIVFRSNRDFGLLFLAMLGVSQWLG